MKKEKCENAISGKQLDSVRKETHVVSVMIQRLETDAIRVLSCTQKLSQRLTGRYPLKVLAAEERANFWNKRKDSVPKFAREKVYESVM